MNAAPIGSAVACPQFALQDHVTGRLDGDMRDPWFVWLVTPAGQRIDVRWPKGFAAFFEPSPFLQLLNDHNTIVASRGEVVDLLQVATSSARGTSDDPYVAAGLIIGQCYVQHGTATMPPVPTRDPSNDDGTLTAPTDRTILAGIEVNAPCTFIGINPHVVGALEVDPTDATWPVHIKTLDGRVVYVLWPYGFRVRPKPLQLIDDRGTVISTGSISLDQVPLTKNAGTKEHPYRATGFVESRCYVTASATP